MTNNKNNVLVLTHNKLLFEAIRTTLKNMYTCQLFEPFTDRICGIDEQKFHCIILDLSSSKDSLKLSPERIIQNAPNHPVIILASERDSRTVKELVEKGAYDYLYAPFEREKLLIMIRNAVRLNKQVNQQQNP